MSAADEDPRQDQGRRPEPETEERILAAYAAFDERDIDAALRAMHADVDWPNMIEGTRARGHDEVRTYWELQFRTTDPQVRPLHMRLDEDDRVVVDVHQVVRDLDEQLLQDRVVQHVFTMRDGLVARMDVVEPPG